MPGESVENFLIRRIQLLYKASTNDVILLSIVLGIDKLVELTTKQQQNLIMQILY